MTAADDHSPYTHRELSLLRSFSTIRSSLVDDATPRQENHCHGEDSHVIAAHQKSQDKRERRGISQSRDSAFQDRSGSQGARRVTIAAPAATTRHGTKASPTSVGAGSLQPQSQVLPPPPFANSGVVALQPPPAPFQRRPFAPFTAKQAHGMVTMLASERRQRRHHEVRRGSEDPVPPSEIQVPFQARRRGFRRDYSLGDSARCFSHLIFHSPMHQATRAAASLKKHDFAFVRRSDGSYVYSIVAYRQAPRVPGEEEFMIFVIDGAGSTKVVERRYWGTFVRLVAAERMDLDIHEGMRGSTGPRNPPSPVELEPHIQFQECPVLCQEIGPPVLCQVIKDGGDCTPVDSIVFSSSMYNDDDCSAISSVSDRAM